MIFFTSGKLKRKIGWAVKPSTRHTHRLFTPSPGSLRYFISVFHLPSAESSSTPLLSLGFQTCSSLLYLRVYFWPCWDFTAEQVLPWARERRRLSRCSAPGFHRGPSPVVELRPEGARASVVAALGLGGCSVRTPA